MQADVKANMWVGTPRDVSGLAALYTFASDTVYTEPGGKVRASPAAPAHAQDLPVSSAWVCLVYPLFLSGYLQYMLFKGASCSFSNVPDNSSLPACFCA